MSARVCKVAKLAAAKKGRKLSEGHKQSLREAHAKRKANTPTILPLFSDVNENH